MEVLVNDFRIDDAGRVLADPAQERLPILNLALDLGFGSPGPFNRAFRAKTGQTPTEHRHARLDSTGRSTGWFRQPAFASNNSRPAT